MKHPLIRYHGGKFRLSDWIISHFTSHETYVEPFGGGASVLLLKQPSRIEVYNDLDDDVVNFFKVLRDEKLSAELALQIELTPYSRTEFLNARADTSDMVEKARRLVIRAQMGFGSAGATKGNTGFRLDTARGGSDIVTIWQRQSKVILQAAARLKQVLIENRDAVKVIEDHDREDTLFFVDPPYVLDTRSMGGKAYRHEMTNADHEQLVSILKNCKGMVILCGYEHPIYETLKWKKIKKSVAAAGQSGSVLREEVLWINPQAENQGDLFSGVSA
ncbi:DNA adenine methylase [Acinetobacter puyangensis]|uniref:DNA adenine methylase n=1 Tax=Acinetobacter puyangensis TaxID=1096779 RepID=UPI003A4E33A1